MVIVNKDMDITNLNEVIRAMCTRCKLDRGIAIIPNFYDFAGLIPQCRGPSLIRQRRGFAKAIIDCRFPAWFKPEEIPPVSDLLEFPEEVRKTAVQKLH